MTAWGARQIALLLVALGVEMTEEADRIVPQTLWDELDETGFIQTRIPLHGDTYTVLTPAGANELENVILDAEAARDGTARPRPPATKEEGP